MSQSGPRPPKTASDKTQRLRAEAMDNVRAARAAIGEEALDRIAAAILKKKTSPAEQAKARIITADPVRVAAEILAMMEKE